MQYKKSLIEWWMKWLIIGRTEKVIRIVSILSWISTITEVLMMKNMSHLLRDLFKWRHPHLNIRKWWKIISNQVNTSWRIVLPQERVTLLLLMVENLTTSWQIRIQRNSIIKFSTRILLSTKSKKLPSYRKRKLK
jgi:hypothetical protein